MAGDTRKPARPAEPEPAPEPPFYLAAEDLYIGGGPDTGTAPARAFAAGDRVPADLVHAHGWAPLVTAPGGEQTTTPPRPAPAADTPDTARSSEQE